MTPDDPRHGTNAGYIAGCRGDCCKKAHAAYRRNLYARQYVARGPMTIPAVGSQRRIRALQAIGWRISDIAGEMNLLVAPNGACAPLWQLLHRNFTTRSTAARVDAVYRRLHMTPGPSNHSRARAVNRGYAPPLAWDDIDDPNATPQGVDHPRNRGIYPDRLDGAVVDRVLAGDWRLPTSRREKQEICRRFLEGGGGSGRQLANLTGWKVERYYRIGDAA